MRASIDELMNDAARHFVEQRLVCSAQEVAGVKHPGKRQGAIRWHGTQRGRITLSERKLAIKRPRLRGTHGGIAIPAYERLRGEAPLGKRIRDILVSGVSTRKYAKVLPAMAGTVGVDALPGAQAHPKTVEWWAKQPAAWAACRKDLEPPERAMMRYVSWIKSLDGRPVFVAYPAGFVFMFVCWYLIKYVGESPFSHSALDIKSFAMAVLKTDYCQSTKRNMPRRWFDDLPHTHVALDDAIEQGALFCNMLTESHS